MSRSLTTASLMLCLLISHGTNIATAWDDQDFFRYCPPTRCSKDEPEIRFPLRLESSNSSPSCGAATCTKLACSGEDTILRHPFLGPSKVIDLDYNNSMMKIVPLLEQQFSECPIQNLTLPADLDDKCSLNIYEAGRLIGCTTEFTPSGILQYGGSCTHTNYYQYYSYYNDTYFVSSAESAADLIAGPIPCLSNPGRFTYLVHACLLMSFLPLDCKVLSNTLVPVFLISSEDEDTHTFKKRAETIIGFSDHITTSWSQWLWTSGFGTRGSITDFCNHCESRGQPCAFSSRKGKPFCMPHSNKGLRHKVIAATSSVACIIVLSLMVATTLYLSLKSKYNEEIHLKVEMFLRTYGTSKPTRYTFAEVKKITRRFKEKLGQGGFGSVYRGHLPNGVPVAVKMLENSTGEGEDFINEVATIGSIHHTNIVRLLGFCSEGTRRALIYEFMPNESLEKHIFHCDSNASQRLLEPNKMLNVALGISRGMEYLHQGCNQRILHFDIKPHNILLDYNFNPKISDFCLAKQCSRDQSIITLTAARGTMGYIAPEIYSRNFGGISYKSDVYRFGMLVLEMVSGKRNSDPSIENQNEVYFPEWIHEKSKHWDGSCN
ncbi:unnamed protein product [Urochloa decumbens]|uniref:non-specific serine/threonine protein kinase n=1 Tax=Urochloa decumbens TaxID=240449 RepID=A0ABC8YYZ4_9POAL